MNSSDGEEMEKQNVIRTYSGTVINLKKRCVGVNRPRECYGKGTVQLSVS